MIKAIGEQIGRGARGYQHRHHQDDAHGLQAGNRCQRQHREQEVMQQARVDADRTGVGGIKAEQQQIAAQDQQHPRHHSGDQQGLLDIAGGDAQHIAKQDVGEIDVAAGFRHQHQAQGEESREHQADHGVFLDAGFLLHKADRRHRAHAEHKGPKGEGQS